MLFSGQVLVHIGLPVAPRPVTLFLMKNIQTEADPIPSSHNVFKQGPFLFGLKVKTARTVPFQANNQVISIRMGRMQFDSFDLSID